MPKYSVHVIQRVIEEAWIDIEADTEEAAQDAAIETAMLGRVEWSFLETMDAPIEVLDVDSQAAEGTRLEP